MKWLKIMLLVALTGMVSFVALASIPEKSDRSRRVLKMQTFRGIHQDVVIGEDGSVLSNDEIVGTTASAAFKKMNERYERNTFSIKPDNSRFATLSSKEINKDNVAGLCFDFLKEHASKTGINANNLVVYNVIPTHNSYIVVFNQKYDGIVEHSETDAVKYDEIIVREGYVRMYVNARGEIKTFAAKYFDDIKLNFDVKESIGNSHNVFDAAKFGLNNEYNYQTNIEAVVILPVFNGRNYDYRLAAEVEVKEPGTELYIAYVDMNTGELIKRKNLNSNAQITVTAKVIGNDPNAALETAPIAYANFDIDNKPYKTNASGVINNLPDEAIGKAYKTNLNGDNAKMYKRIYPAETGGTIYEQTGTVTTDGILMSDSNNYDEIMRSIYNNVNIVKNYYWAIDPVLSITDLNVYAQVIEDPSFLGNMGLTFNAYASGDQSISLLCANHSHVHMGRLNKVLFHEYGHSIVRAKYVSLGQNGMTSSTGNEACADITAAFLTGNPRVFDDITVPEYEQWAIGNGFFRTCENDYTYPENVGGEGHFDSQILTGAFWDFKQAFGDDEDKFYEVKWTIHSAKNWLPDGYTLQEMYSSWFDALVRANDEWGEGGETYTYNFNEIYNAFEKHKIGLNLLIQDRFTHSNVADEESTTKSIPVVATLSDIAIPQEIDFYLNYYTSENNEIQTLDMTRTNSSTGWEYEANIPAQSKEGTLVFYYFTYKDPVSNQIHKINNDYFALVGYKKLVDNNCESENGWFVQNSNIATNGFTIKAPPLVTQQNQNPGNSYLYSPGYVTSGNRCWTTNISVDYQNRNYVSTSLKDTSAVVSSIMDFTGEPALFLTYNVYYVQRQGSNLNGWLAVQVSFDAGTTWETVDTIKGMQQPKNWEWARRYVSLGTNDDLSNVMVRFLCFANNSSIGFVTLIDDIKIFSTPNPNNIDDDKFAMDVVVSPNPANESINISLPTSLDNVEINITDAMGKIVATAKHNGEITNTDFNISNLDNGTYFISVKSNSTRLWGRFAINK